MPGIVRTAVPLLVQWLLTVAGLEQLGVTSDQLAPTVASVVALVLYVLVRLLERRWPSVGWLLGFPQAPTYKNSRTVPGEVVDLSLPGEVVDR